VALLDVPRECFARSLLLVDDDYGRAGFGETRAVVAAEQACSARHDCNFVREIGAPRRRLGGGDPAYQSLVISSA
jgi:hypothetical protein